MIAPGIYTIDATNKNIPIILSVRPILALKKRVKKGKIKYPRLLIVRAINKIYIGLGNPKYCENIFIISPI